MADITSMEAEVKEFMLQLETVQSSLQVDPDNTELQSLKTELEELIALTKQSIDELRPPAEPQTVPEPAKEKWSKENHPAYQAGYRKPAPPAPTTVVDATLPQEEQTQPASFCVNDNVLARWTSGDGAFYPARITSLTGSATNPIYIVSFKSYSTIETLSSKDIRPLSATDSKKRKADNLSSSPGIVAPHIINSTTSGNDYTNGSSPNIGAESSVISAAADINPDLASQARNVANQGDSSARPSKAARKVKRKKDLEAGKNKWQDFTNKSKFGKIKKESMFRTPEGINARVGFTGSGQQMRKDPTRSRHTYSQEDDVY
ncbi:hypothetical protein McanMca71_005439 [Microsporum canis]|uniref:Tudor domain-containing protein n=1 Tax=Arthroderma otae (strain ATCC MYA-4605 / CBS 113480) TaxID=554155 RepID=C5FQM5_ARTOC|nr:conserved hypothetical protein [Microsporum canis CBS 113480]EEQ32178.1 conserved hypothetical protein [Microsporum canis CBS 113480]